jgi:hypothetical protein
VHSSWIARSAWSNQYNIRRFPTIHTTSGHLPFRTNQPYKHLTPLGSQEQHIDPQMGAPHDLARTRDDRSHCDCGYYRRPKRAVCSRAMCTFSLIWQFNKTNIGTGKSHVYRYLNR